MHDLYIMLVDREYNKKEKKKDVLYFITEPIKKNTDLGSKDTYYSIRPHTENGELFNVSGYVRICKKEDEKKVKQEMINTYAKELKKEKEEVLNKVRRVIRFSTKENFNLNVTL